MKQEVTKKQIKEFNETYAVIQINSKVRVLKRSINTKGFQVIDFLPINDFFNYHGNNLKVAKAWFKSPDRNTYDGICFNPSQEPQDGNFFNTYVPPSIKPKKGNWRLLRWHIKHIICDGDKKLFKYVMMWLARAVQDPGGERPGTALVFLGKRGTGKGKLVRWYRELFKPHYYQAQNKDHVIGKHNKHLGGTILLFADEALFSGDKSIIGPLNGLITEDQIMCEPKYMDAYQLDNHVNLIMATNNLNAVPATTDERRYCICEVSDKKRKDKRYFQAIDEQMENGGLEAMYHDLLKVKVDKLSLRQIPHNDGLTRQVLENLDPLQKFWIDYLSRGKFQGLRYEEYMKKIDIVHLYNSSCKEWDTQIDGPFWRKTNLLFGVNGKYFSKPGTNIFKERDLMELRKKFCNANSLSYDVLFED